MEAENWKKVKEILEKTLDLEISKREDFLNSANLSPEIRAEVESLLTFETESEDLMHLSAVEFSKDFFDEDDPKNSIFGQTFGVYKVISELGYGGMGAVYLATRTDGKFNQKVALKLLKREMNTAALRRRFRQEREILASLEHPNIARLLDAGTTEDNIPYIAMEYVEGLPIDDFCSKNRLDLSQRLDLFREVCAAVDFAHRNLIVHRDLKPSNILVNEEGKPKLLDFGISKILSNEIAPVNSATVTKLGVMTPSYASPEQLQSKSVTTATDIYSLGVILYELLSGHRPFETKEDNLKEIYKAVLETDPPLPSSMVETVSREFKTATEAETVIISEKANSPGKRKPVETEANKMRRTNLPSVKLSSNSLRGDLDNIILKALRKEPERRYRSAENFSEDIKRHLKGLPVTARPNTFSYRAEKFFNRNKASVVAGMLIFLAIVGGIAATFWQARVAQAERVKAENRFNDVRTLANSFILEFSPKIENLPGSLPARELLVKRALEYLDNLSKEAGDDSELQKELAAAYEKVGDLQGNPGNPNLGDSKGAIESYEKVVAVREKLAAQNPEDLTAKVALVDIYERLGSVYVFNNDLKKRYDYYDKAINLMEQILARQPENFEYRAKFAELLRKKGLGHANDQEYKKALEFYERAREINKKLYAEKPDEPEIVEQYGYIFTSIGEAQAWDTDLENGMKNLQKALEILVPLTEKYPNNSAFQRSLMLSYIKIAEIYEDSEAYDKSTEFFTKALEASQQQINADPQNFQAKRDVAMAYKKLGQTLDWAGKSLESVEKLKIALEGFQEIVRLDPNYAEGAYDVANTRFSLGETYATIKNYQPALETFLAAQSEFKTVLEKNPLNNFARRMDAYNSTRIAFCYENLAEKTNRSQYLQKAEENYRTGLEKLYNLRNEGKLSKYDNGQISELEKQLETLKKKIG